jgi:hypothetical protein
MPLNLYPNIRASGSVPEKWRPAKASPEKFPVYNAPLLKYLRRLKPGKWQKVIKQGDIGEFTISSMNRAAWPTLNSFPLD